MPRNRQRVSTRCSWENDAMTKAVNAVKIGGMPLLTAAKQFNVPRNTLRRRILNTSAKKFGNRSTFDEATEKELENHLLNLDAIGYGLTISDLRALAYKFAVKNNIKHKFSEKKEVAGYDWVYGFMKRHPKLSIRKAEGLSHSRAKAMNKEEILNYFQRLENKIEELQLHDKPSHIFNCDETGLQLIFKPKKQISLKGKRDVYSQTNAEKGETVSVMCCASAAGCYIPPFVIMKGVRKKPEFSIGMPPGTMVAMSESGYMKAQQFSIWLDHFITFKPQGQVLLILDGHGSHCSEPDTLQKAVDNNITLMCLPAHSSHRLQPLDVGLFGPLKKFYNEACRQWVRAHPGRSLSKIYFGDLLSQAWGQAATPNNVINSFNHCGIYPVNALRITDDVYLPSDAHNEPQSCDLPTSDDRVTVGEAQRGNIANVTPTAVEERSNTTQSESVSCSSSFEDLSPIPRGRNNPVARKRKSAGTNVITSPEFIDSVKENKRKKDEREQKKKQKEHEKNKKMHKKNNIPSTSSASQYVPDEENYCKECGGYYFDEQRKQPWVECLQCHAWYHEKCVDGGNDPYFVCYKCHEDDSD